MSKRFNKGFIGYPVNGITGIFSFNEIYSDSLEVYDIEYIVLAGGGQGHGYLGGGGAGGVLCSEIHGKINLSLNVPYKIIVGAGGSGTNNNTTQAQGNNSQFTDFIIAYGGGRYQMNGGSGGGNLGKGVYPGSVHISEPRQGYDGAGPRSEGGSAQFGTQYSKEAGGGGAGEPAEDLNTIPTGHGEKSGDGGNGITLSLLNSINYGVLHTDGNYYIAGGGGGGKNTDAGRDPGSLGAGGLGGGGSGLSGVPYNGSYGSGGGGGRVLSSGGLGGDGVIIIKIPDNITVTLTSGATYTTTAVTGNVIYTITETTSTDETITLT